VSSVVRQQQRNVSTPKLARHPTARWEPRDSRTDSSTCSLSRLPAQSNDQRQQSSKPGAILDPCPDHCGTENKHSTLRLFANICKYSTFSRTSLCISNSSNIRNRNHEPAPAEQGGHQRTSLAAPASIPRVPRRCFGRAAASVSSQI
jgi:hypothetical protein